MMKLHAEITAPTVKSELRLRDLKPGALFRFVEPHGVVVFGLVVERWDPSRAGFVRFYEDHHPTVFDMKDSLAEHDLVELIEGPDAFVTLTSTP